jgi:protease YdgD
MNRYLLLLCLAVLPGAGPLLPGLGAEGAANPRVRVDMRAAPWRAVVRVQSPGLSRCTGFMVAPDVVVTAAHCLFSLRLGGLIPAGSVHVLSGYDSGGFAAHAIATSYRIGAGHDPRNPDGTRGSDIAVLRLSAALLPAGEVLRLADDAGEGSVTLGGFNQDRAEIIEADPACHLRGIGRDPAGLPLLAHDCAATRGSSGGPLLGRDRQGGWQVLGVQVAGRVGGLGGVAVPAASVRALMTK